MNRSNISSDKMSQRMSTQQWDNGADGRHSFTPYSDAPYISQNGIRVSRNRYLGNNPVVNERRSIIYPSAETDELVPVFEMPIGDNYSMYRNNNNYTRNNFCR